MITDKALGRIKRSYRKWSSMQRRCMDSGHPAWSRYGGRGIYVCDRWTGRTGYDNFVADMGEPPEGLTLGRINNDGPYEPSNCRWETWKQQAANRAKVGPPLDPNSIKGKARAAGLPYMVVYLRIKKLFWTERRALTTPVGKHGKTAFQNAL